MGILTSPAASLPVGTTFDRWWHCAGAWVEPANQRRGGESGVQLLQPRDPERPPLYCKRQSGHTYRSLWHPFGRPTVLRELQAYRAFARLGVGVPRLVYGAARKQQGQWQALLVTEALAGFISLEDWYAAGGQGQGNPLNAAVLEQLAAMLAHLHRAGWQHGCCYPKHLFVKVIPQAEGAPLIETAMLDLEKSRRRWSARNAGRRDLRQLWRHRGAIPEADLDQLQQTHERLLAAPAGDL